MGHPLTSQERADSPSDYFGGAGGLSSNQEAMKMVLHIVKISNNCLQVLSATAVYLGILVKVEADFSDLRIPAP